MLFTITGRSTKYPIPNIPIHDIPIPNRLSPPLFNSLHRSVCGYQAVDVPLDVGIKTAGRGFRGVGGVGSVEAVPFFPRVGKAVAVPVGGGRGLSQRGPGIFRLFVNGTVGIAALYVDDAAGTAPHFTNDALVECVAPERGAGALKHLQVSG